MKEVSIADLMKEISKLEKRLESKTAEIDSMQKDLEMCIRQRNTAESQYAELCSEKKQWEELATGQASDIDSLQEQCSVRYEAIEKLNEENRQLKQLADDNERLQEELESMNYAKQEAEEVSGQTVKRCAEELSDLSFEKQELQETVESLRKEVDDLCATVNILQSEKKEAQEIIADRTKDVQHYDEENKRLKENNEILQKAYDEQEARAVEWCHKYSAAIDKKNQLSALIGEFVRRAVEL